MILVLQVLLIAFCVQGLVKFAVGFLVPYSTRIRRLASYYSRGGRIIGVYDTATLIVMAVLVVLLFLTELQYLSFITGIVVGMLTIQIFFHRFSRVLAQEKAPETPTPPRKLMSYAIQADPALAWREIIFMAGALHMGAVHAAHQLHVEPVGVMTPDHSRMVLTCTPSKWPRTFPWYPSTRVRSPPRACWPSMGCRGSW
jgi:hypothetical protein